MNDWLHKKFFTNHPVLETWFHIFIVIVTLLIIYLVINFIVDKFSPKNKIKINLIKSIIIGLAIPIVAVWLWYNSSNNNPTNEYLLITQSKTTEGFITNAGEREEEVEPDNGPSGIKYSFSYDYTFRLPNGKIISAYGVEDGSRLPDDMHDLAIKPYKVEVQYLPDNPEVNRVKDFLWHNSTVYEWFRFNILLGVIILIVCSYFGYLIIKAGIKKYSMEMKKITSNI